MAQVAALGYLCALAQEVITPASLKVRTSSGYRGPGRAQSDPTGATQRSRSAVAEGRNQLEEGMEERIRQANKRMRKKGNESASTLTEVIMHRTIQVATVLLFIANVGCSDGTAHFSGIVVTEGKKGFTSSVKQHYSTVPEQGQQPVEGVQVYLAYDRAGDNPTQDFHCISDAAGLYSMSGHWPPQRTDGRTTYYLIAKKDGYAICAWPHYSNNLTPDRKDDRVILGKK